MSSRSNDYDYVGADPINAFDLDGRMCFSLKCAKKRAKSVRGFMRDHAGEIGFALSVGAMVASGPAGWALAGGAIAAGAYSARRNARNGDYGKAALDMAGTAFGGVGIGARAASAVARGAGRLQLGRTLHRGSRRLDAIGIALGQQQIAAEHPRRGR